MSLKPEVPKSLVASSRVRAFHVPTQFTERIGRLGNLTSSESINSQDCSSVCNGHANLASITQQLGHSKP